MAFSNRGEGRVIVGLPERVEKQKIVIRDLENKLSQVRLLLEHRDERSDPDALLNVIEEIVESKNV